MRRLGFGCVAVIAAVGAGCARTQKSEGLEDVRRIVEERAGYRWEAESQEGASAGVTLEPPEPPEAPEGLPDGELSVEQAVRVALLRNPQLRAVYAELGLGLADVAEASRIENPVLAGRGRFPDGGGRANLEFELTAGFLDLLMKPARKRLAGAQLERTKRVVADRVLETVAEVEQAYYELVGAQQLVEMQRLIVEASEASYEMAKRLREAGNADELTVALEGSAYEGHRAEVSLLEVGAFEAREKLARLMGLGGEGQRVRVPARLAGVPGGEADLRGLEELAVSRRLDLEAARREVGVLAEALEVQRDWRWIGDAEVSVDVERDTDGSWVTGPGGSVELPVFHQHQAEIARLEAQVEQAEQRARGLEVQVRSEVRELSERLTRARGLAERYRDVVIPLRQRVVELELQKYNFMLGGVFEVLMAKEAEYEAYGAYIEAVRDYWVARSRLERGVGGRLPGAEGAGAQPAIEVPSGAGGGPHEGEGPRRHDHGHEHEHEDHTGHEHGGR